MRFAESNFCSFGETVSDPFKGDFLIELSQLQDWFSTNDEFT